MDLGRHYRERCPGGTLLVDYVVLRYSELEQNPCHNPQMSLWKCDHLSTAPSIWCQLIPWSTQCTWVDIHAALFKSVLFQVFEAGGCQTRQWVQGIVRSTICKYPKWTVVPVVIILERCSLVYLTSCLLSMHIIYAFIIDLSVQRSSSKYGI